jgi:hypothetical protein
MLLDDIINTIIEKISNIPLENPVFIYTGVGASGSIDHNGILQLENYHQYPPFLQNLKNTIPNLHIFIILIDPYQENPPYMVNDKNLILEPNVIEPNVIDPNVIDPNVIDPNSNIECYSNNTNNLTVYVMRKCVYTDPYEEKPDYINITKQLQHLNSFAIKNNITTLYHDFTGRKNALLAEFFDKELNNDLDHIVYSLSAREDHGCKFDLTDISSYFPFRIDFQQFLNHNKRVIIRLFNIFRFTEMDTIKDKLEIEINNYPPYMRAMIEKQKDQVINSIKTELRNEIFTILRLIVRLVKGEETYEEIKNVYFFNNLPEYEKTKSLTMYHEKKFNNLLDYLMNYYGKKIDTVSKIKDLDVSGREILEFIINGENPYDWYNSLNNFF